MKKHIKDVTYSSYFLSHVMYRTGKQATSSKIELSNIDNLA
ncbi:hypothetical protein [Ancylomarina euxinus]|nr:hypothetical protein [Ancylomarina euxinus]MCZ4695693.1 hypothetical protein [Ancylomarina euxinus]